ncbi:MAG: class I SAM-dependent RNA methyltransferase, partial [Bacteroidales bacterium]|nr:class I SAM-dependent RNA methyltransferase [Bacteroidales bacterium]
MARKTKPYLEDITIEATAAEGNGLAHVDGKVVFVRQGIPGDVVDVQINKVRSGYSQGYIARMKSPSPHRLKPFCAHFEDCGGCTWQTLPYPMQIAFKQQQVVDQLTRIGHLELPEVSPILGSAQTDHYRNKLEFTFSNHRWLLPGEDWQTLSAEELLGLGFHVSGFFDKVLDIQECHLQREPSNAIRLFIRQYAIERGLSFYDLRENRGFLRTMIVRTTSTGENMLVICFGGEAQGEDARPAREALLEAVSTRFPEITSLYYVINPKGNDNFSDLPCTLYSGAEAVYERMEDLRFKIGPKSFYQTNSAQAYRLYSVVRDFVKEGLSVLS